MTTAAEQAILHRAGGRCLANRREFRRVGEDGIFCIGWLARLINLGLVSASDRRLTPEMVDAMAADVMPLNQSDQVGAFADLTLTAPCLALLRPDGREVLVDGLKRARQSFALGRPDVPAKVMLLEDARRLGMSAEFREHWKVLEATEYHPVGARQKRNFDKVIVKLSDDREGETPGRGQPSFSDDQNILSDNSDYHLVALIELEFYIYKDHPGSALFKHIQRGLTRPAWAEEFLRELFRSGRLPVAQSTSEVANQAGATIARVAGRGNRAAYKRFAKANWLGMLPEALTQDRDATLDICAAIMKADLRLRLRQTFSRKLVKWENNTQRAVSWRSVHSAIEGSDAHYQQMFNISSLRLREQLKATYFIGVNMNDVYHDHTNIDPLFQSYAFIFCLEKDKRASADPYMVEAVVHRRAMDILGQSDDLTECWEDFFRHWQNLGLDDASLLDVAHHLDVTQSVYNGKEVLFV